jgi:predicted TIM-barrel fold metal-dependent hydrolase
MAGLPTNRSRPVGMFDLTNIPLIDDHSHAGLYERRLGRLQTLADLNSPDEHYESSAYRALLREACANLYGEEKNWRRGISEQYAQGIEPAYTQMLDRLLIRAILWDFRRLNRHGWPADRYRLIYWIDQYIYPFAHPSLWRGEELQAALAEALDESGLGELPHRFDEYLAFVERTLRQARPHVVGLKLLVGYQRSLRFDPVPLEAASRAYLDLRAGNVGAYGSFQDFMARWLFKLAGELDLPLQIHASFGGPSSHLQLQNNDPTLLQPLLSDPANGATRVVLLHGGYPYISHAGALAWQYPQVYLDFSVLPTLYTVPLARWLEEWIELLPRNKILFGTDASSPEEYYTAAVNARRQLGVALDHLLSGGALTRPEAADLADRICHQNAIELYRLDDLRLAAMPFANHQH